ncbi:MAG TPA: cupin domain-containing protein [Terriglobia bacterium]|nr:cupin domain-containing protein [Terriglobia bacterium]
MTYSRRDLCLLVAALAAAPGVAAQKTALPSKVFPYEELPVRKNGGNESRPVLEGELHDGCYLEVHQTKLAPGAMPHPAHHHLHEEMFLVREGAIEITISGKSTQLGPGSVGFVGSNDEHGIRNPGAAHAQYFVVAFGKDT